MTPGACPLRTHPHPATDTRSVATLKRLIEQNDVDVESPSTLRLTQAFPPKYEHREVTTFTMVIEQPGDGSEPQILTTRNPMVLIGQLTQFPPRGDLYTLEKPVELIDLEDPAKVVAVIEKFPVKVGGL